MGQATRACIESVIAAGACAYLLCRILLEPWLGRSLVAELAVATVGLYGSNSFLLAKVLALVDRKPLGAVWQLCYFWTLPCYLVGAAVAGVMTATWRMADWPASLLVLTLLHVRQAVDRIEQAPT